jgi:hypothetical protein
LKTTRPASLDAVLPVHKAALLLADIEYQLSALRDASPSGYLKAVCTFKPSWIHQMHLADKTNRRLARCSTVLHWQSRLAKCNLKHSESFGQAARY